MRLFKSAQEIINEWEAKQEYNLAIMDLKEFSSKVRVVLMAVPVSNSKCYYVYNGET